LFPALCAARLWFGISDVARIFGATAGLICLLFADRYAKATEEDKKEADKMFRKVGEAYAILSDKQKRFDVN